MIVLLSNSSSCNNSNEIVPSFVDGDIVAVIVNVSSQYYAISYTCSWVSFFVSLFVLF